MAFERIEDVAERHLHIFWTNGDPMTSENMVLMYARNAMLNGWWDRVTVVLWGAPQKLFAESEAVRLKVRLTSQAGAEFSACLSCAVNMGTKQALEEENIEVIRWGEKLSLLMQNGKHVLTV